MDRKKKRRIAVMRSIIIVMLLLCVNCIVGNPVSNLLAKQAAQQYINNNYSEQNLQIQKAGYNYKVGQYLIFVQSSTSPDTAFAIYADSYGNIIRDDYAYEVANHFTTFRRLDGELREAAQNILGSKMGYDFAYLSLAFVEEGDMQKLARDMELDIHNPPLPLTMHAVLYSDDVSYHKIAEVAKALELALEEQEIPIVEYNIQVVPLSDKPQKKGQTASWENALSVSEFPAERMHEKNLPQAMEQFERSRIAAMHASLFLCSI